MALRSLSSTRATLSVTRSCNGSCRPMSAARTRKTHTTVPSPRTRGRTSPAARATGGSSRSLRKPAAAVEFELQLATRRPWVPGPVTLRGWAEAAHVAGMAALPVRKRRVHASLEKRASLLVRVVDSVESRRLDREFRGKDKPTNVLSFPASPEERVASGALGDLVICAPVVAREAHAQHKALGAHWA